MTWKQSLRSLLYEVPSILVGGAIMVGIIFVAMKVVDYTVTIKEDTLQAAEIWQTVKPTGSMQPCIGANDRFVFNENLSNYTLRVGDIVKYRQSIDEEEYYILHRIVFVINTSQLPNSSVLYIVKGDANPYPDQWLVKPSDVLAVVSKIGYR